MDSWEEVNGAAVSTPRPGGYPGHQNALVPQIDAFEYLIGG
jgi:hypothetical protein